MAQKANRTNRSGAKDPELDMHPGEAEETLRAIHQYLVDAFVVTRPDGSKVVTLSDADFPYRLMVESMNEGAATLTNDGTIFYCNPRFAEMLHEESGKLIGLKFQDYMGENEKQGFQSFLGQAAIAGNRQQLELQTSEGICVPVQISMYRLSEGQAGAVSLIATDVSQHVEAERKIRTLLSELTMAEQDERQRISEVLHDDLQQRLFAIKAQLSFLQEPGGQDAEASSRQREVELIQNWLSDAINIARNLSIDLSPMILQGEGLAEAIVWLNAQMKRRYGLEVKLEAQKDMYFMDKSLRMLIFQAVRELLFNVVKHSETLKATVKLRKFKEANTIIVSDEGKGFDSEAVLSDQALAHGLLLLKDRLALIGCSLDVDSAPGRGTRVSIIIPERVHQISE